MTSFAYPLAFLLLFLPFVWRWVVPAVKGLHGDALRVPFINDLEKISIKSGVIWKLGSASANKGYSRLFWVLYTIWTLLVIAVARPQWVGEPIRLPQDSRDIMLVLDISTSMLAKDFTYQGHRLDRLTAVKKTASDFIRKRSNDRVGLVLFGTRAYQQSPLTYDHKSIEDILWSMDAGMAGDSTSIGDALGLALKNIRQNKKSDNKIIILLTDGENNDGSLSLPQAIKLAADEGIKTYTIGVGAKSSFMGLFMGGVTGVDERGLKALAAATNAQYFRAEDTSSLQNIYQAIDELEPSVNQDKFIRETKELYFIPLLAAIFLALVLSLILRRIN